MLTRGRDIHHIKIAIDPHVVAPFEARPIGLLPAVQAPNLANWLRLR